MAGNANGKQVARILFKEIVDGMPPDESLIYRVVYFKAEDVVLNVPDDNSDLF